MEARIKELADRYGKQQGLSRREFLGTSCGMAAAFLAMNEVFGGIFGISEAEAADPARSAERAKALENQFIFDVQTHFVHDGYTQEGILAGSRNMQKSIGTRPSPMRTNSTSTSSRTTSGRFFSTVTLPSRC